MGNIFFNKDQQIEMFFADYLNNLDLQNKKYRKKYFLPLISHFDFFNDIILRILKRTENKQKINLICNGLFILSFNVDFILGNELENHFIEIIKDLNIKKKGVLKNLVLFIGVLLLNVEMNKLKHGYNFKQFRNKFKKVLSDLKLRDQLNRNLTKSDWISLYFSWVYDFGISNRELFKDPKRWFLSLLK